MGHTCARTERKGKGASRCAKALALFPVTPRMRAERERLEAEREEETWGPREGLSPTKTVAWGIEEGRGRRAA